MRNKWSRLLSHYGFLVTLHSRMASTNPCSVDWCEFCVTVTTVHFCIYELAHRRRCSHDELLDDFSQVQWSHPIPIVSILMFPVQKGQIPVPILPVQDPFFVALHERSRTQYPGKQHKFSVLMEFGTDKNPLTAAQHLNNDLVPTFNGFIQPSHHSLKAKIAPRTWLWEQMHKLTSFSSNP